MPKPLQVCVCVGGGGYFICMHVLICVEARVESGIMGLHFKSPKKGEEISPYTVSWDYLHNYSMPSFPW